MKDVKLKVSSESRGFNEESSTEGRAVHVHTASFLSALFTISFTIISSLLAAFFFFSTFFLRLLFAFSLYLPTNLLD